jgi:hypothetical protein
MLRSRSHVGRRMLLATVLLAVALIVPVASVSAKPGDLAATPALVNLGPLPAGTEGTATFTLTNNTSQTFTSFNVDFVTINSSGLAQTSCPGFAPLGPDQSCTMQVFMGPVNVGPAVMRVRWRSGSASSNWVFITATGT